MKKWVRKKYVYEEQSLFTLINQNKHSDDFVHFYNSQSPQPYWISYFSSLIDLEILHRDLLPYLNKTAPASLEELQAGLPFENIVITNALEKVQNELLNGSVLIQFDEKDPAGALVPAEMKKARAVTMPEEEYSVVGPKESFVESLSTNINLIRKRLPVSELQVKEMIIGTLSKTKVSVLYIEGIANE